jgi:hypothetical protein
MILYMCEGKEGNKKLFTTSLWHNVVFDLLLCNLRHGLHYSRSKDKRMMEKS